MSSLTKAGETFQGAIGESQATLRELAEELSLELSPEPAAAVRGSPAGKTSGSGAGLFSARPSLAGSRRQRVTMISLAALLLFSSGWTYRQFALGQPSPLAVTPFFAIQPTPQAASLPPMVPQPEGASTSQFESLAQPQPAQNTPSPRKARVALHAEGINAIEVRRGSQAEISPDLAQGYLSLQEGRLAAAESHYRRHLQQEPGNVDALLGMAEIAARSKRMSDAGKFYLRALEVEPNNAFALAGLLNMLGRSDPEGSETRLKQLLEVQPEGALYFVLGNLYASQFRWNEAQQAYFQAHHLESGNPDYAFNLAVSLEHIGLPGQALEFYRNALLLQRQRKAGFEGASAEARIAQLQRKGD